jgi:hypothetical protein
MKMKRTPVLEVTGFRQKQSPHAGVAPSWACELRYAGLTAAGYVLQGEKSVSSNDSFTKIRIEPTRTDLEIFQPENDRDKKILNLIVIPTGKFQTEK